MNTHVKYWISHLYFVGVAAAQLRWHLSNTIVIKSSNRYFYRSENFAEGEINGRSFSKLNPWCIVYRQGQLISIPCYILILRSHSLTDNKFLQDCILL